MIDITPEDRTLVRQLIATYFPDVEVRVFGSRYNGTARPYSDLDLALVGQEKLNWLTVSRLREAFAESELSYRVDVLDWHAIAPTFQQVIARGYAVLDIFPQTA